MFKFCKKKHRCFARSGLEWHPGYVEPAYTRDQYFVRDTILLGILVHRRVLFRERVPSYAWISYATVGYADWKTGCPADIWKLCTGKDL